MTEMHLDVETRSTLDLRKVGSYQYFEHPTTDIWCAAYSFDDEEPAIWHPGESCPQRIIYHINAGGICTAFNAAFERLGWKHLLYKKYGWPKIEDKQFRCTMVEALALNLPGALDKAAPATGLDITKDEKGSRLMMQMCRPRKTLDGSLRWWDDQDRRDRLDAYCKQDVRVEVAIANRVLRIVPNEQQLYLLDMKINDRGVYIDYKLCLAAQRVVEEAMKKLDYEMLIVTEGDVQACSQILQITKFLAKHGVDVESVDKESIADLLIREDLPPVCKKVLELRQEGSKTSTAKIRAMLERRDPDGRARGNLQFYGASSTLRWAARGIQLQNLPRPILLKGSKTITLEEQIDTAIGYIMTGNSAAVEMAYDKPLTLVADCIRSMICAAPGNQLYASDFSNIEGRVVAWIAGQVEALKAFSDFDKGVGADIYLLAAAAIYGVSVEAAKPFRQVGKVASLALGFGGGAGAFAKMAKGYGLKIASLCDGIWERADKTDRAAAEKAWLNPRARKLGLSREGFIAAELIKIAWRRKNYNIAAYWKISEEAAVSALENPGTVFTAGKVKFKKAGSFLFALLPSGRTISYPYARMAEVKDEEGRTRRVIKHKSVSQFTKKWEDRIIWGGLITENLTQAIARDIMAEAMQRTDKAGYRNVLTVHDELVAEVPLGFGSMEEFDNLIRQSPKWADGLPIEVAGWTGQRYRKS